MGEAPSRCREARGRAMAVARARGPLDQTAVGQQRRSQKEHVQEVLSESWWWDELERTWMKKKDMSRVILDVWLE